MSKVGQIIKEKRLNLHMTTTEVAAKVGVSDATISRWENGEINSMRLPLAYKLSQALHSSILDFIPEYDGFSGKILNTINERIKKIRKEEKMNQRDFGSLIGLTQSAVSWIEIPHHNVTEQNLKSIMSVFNVSEDWLRTGEGSMYTSSELEEAKKISENLKLTPAQRKLLEIFLDMPPSKRERVARAFLSLYGIDFSEESTEVNDFKAEVEKKEIKEIIGEKTVSRSSNICESM